MGKRVVREEPLSEMLCSHANECPNVCECSPRCYCYAQCKRVGRKEPGAPTPKVRRTIREGRFHAEEYPGGVLTVGDCDDRVGLHEVELFALLRLIERLISLKAQQHPKRRATRRPNNAK